MWPLGEWSQSYLTELFLFVLIPFKARHAEDVGATAIGLMATSYFTPKSVGVYSFPPPKAGHSEMILFVTGFQVDTE